MTDDIKLPALPEACIDGVSRKYSTWQLETYARDAVRLNASQAERADQVQALREALEEIRSRSCMNLATNPNPLALTAMLGDIHQIADAALEQEEWE